MTDRHMLGIRIDDWETAAKEMLTPEDRKKMHERTAEIAIARNVFENERNHRLCISGGCATHRD